MTSETIIAWVAKLKILTVAVWLGYYRQQIAPIKIPKMKRFILVPLTSLAAKFFLIEEFILGSNGMADGSAWNAIQLVKQDIKSWIPRLKAIMRPV